MTGKKARLDKLCTALTAQERAILVLRSWKDGQDEDGQIRGTMPLGQVTELNAYIDLMHGISDLAPFILLLQQHAAQLGLRSAWLSTLDFWAITAFSLASYIWFDTKEPITESDHKRRVEEARSKTAAVVELAEVLTERHDGWTEDDLEPAEDDEEPVVSDKAWNRVLAQKKKELAAEFDGEDPLPPPVRSLVDETRAELQQLIEKTQRRVGPFGLPDPDEDALAKLRTIANLPEPRQG